MEHLIRTSPIYSVVIEDVEYFDSIYLKDTSRPTKVILLKPDEKIPIWWRGLTAEFKNRIEVIMIVIDSFLKWTQMSLF